MRLGIALPHYDSSLAGRPATWSGVAEVAGIAERSGFDSVWVSDHLFLDWAKYGGDATIVGSLECWTTLSGLAAVTDRVRLGTLALCNDLRNPALLAKMAASLDRLSGGRLELGIGAGWYEPEYRAAGIPFDRPGVRIARLGEAVEIITQLLDGDEVTFKGEHYTIDGAVCRPGPQQEPRPRVWVCGKGDRVVATAAAVGDGWNYSWVGDVDGYRRKAALADELCERAGRDPKSLLRSVGAYVLVARDDSDLERRFARLVERSPAGVLSEVSLDEFRGHGIVGTVQEVVDGFGQLQEAGVSEVIVGLGAIPFQVGDPTDVELVGTEIGAAVRRQEEVNP
jgi:probable F420-dependent oxidoreductase